LLTRGSGILLWISLFFFCVDAISLSMGVGLGAVLSFAGVGGIALSLATKDMVSNLVGGAIIFATNPFAEGDKISFTNLETSRVSKIGWYQTVVCGDDEQVQTVPNQKFISNKVSNKTRRTHRCMKQSILLKYDCLSKVDQLIKDLRRDIYARGDVADGTVDGSTKNFRIHLAALTETAVEIEFEIHFIGGCGNAFRQARQETLLLIAQAVQDCGASFVVFDTYIPMSRSDDRNLS